MTEKHKQKLIEEAAKIQPDKTLAEIENELDEKSKEIYAFMQEFYNECCKRDISFHLLFNLGQNYRPVSFWRVCDINTKEGEERYSKVLDNTFRLMWKILIDSGYASHLQEHGIIKILDKK